MLFEVHESETLEDLLQKIDLAADSLVPEAIFKTHRLKYQSFFVDVSFFKDRCYTVGTLYSGLTTALYISNLLDSELEKEEIDIIYPAASKITTFLHETHPVLLSQIPGLIPSYDVQLDISPASYHSQWERLLDHELPIPETEKDKLLRWLTEFLELTTEEVEEQRGIAKRNNIGVLPHLCGVASLFNQMSGDAKNVPCSNFLFALGFGDLCS